MGGTKYVKGKHPGATWRKTDFQIHTPRDAGWKGARYPGGTPENEASRHVWARRFLEEALARGISAIAITDHHDVAMIPYVQTVLNEDPDLRDRIWFFPGMEVTCKDSVQCLILFDQGTTIKTLDRLFGGHLQSLEKPENDDEIAPQAEHCGRDITDFLGSIYEDASLKPITIALPHASKSGHKDILRKGFHPRFADLSVDGVYNERSFASLDEITLKKIYGKIEDWSTRRRGIITTGDNRDHSFSGLGLNPCWIRLGEPTAEAIRQAVLADQARIAYDQPEQPSHRIIGLKLSTSLTGPDFELSFNDGFNSIIGGRGSGKSAILEYLRFGLGRSIIDEPADVNLERERELITSTLMPAGVEVLIERNGIRETWKRTLDKSNVITVVDVSGNMEQIGVLEARDRFKARAFYQKQLSTLVRKKETSDEQITGIAAAELVDRRHECTALIASAESEIHASFCTTSVGGEQKPL